VLRLGIKWVPYTYRLHIAWITFWGLRFTLFFTQGHVRYVPFFLDLGFSFWSFCEVSRDGLDIEVVVQKHSGSSDQARLYKYYPSKARYTQ
jgi:hypothetical protein